MKVTQQEQIIFIALPVYGANNAPTWFAGTRTEFTSVNTAGDRTYTGRLYSTSGTPFAVTPFVTPVGVTDVGSPTFVGKADGMATLSYTVTGATVNKNIARQTFAQPNTPQNVAITYSIQDAGTTANCARAADNGSGIVAWITSPLTINGGAMTLVFKTATDPFTCTYTGNNYTQEGRYGKATLIGRCVGQPASWVDQTLTVREFEIGQNFFTAQYSDRGGPSATCLQTGVFTGIKVGQLF